MTLDIRTKLKVASSGPLDTEVISFQASDSAVPGAGLIFTRGTMELLGLQTNILSPGSVINIQMFPAKGGKQEFPRTLHVLGASYNGITDITTLELGCALTLYRSWLEDKVLTPDFTLARRDEFEVTDGEIITLPFYVQSIFEYCCEAIGLNQDIEFGGLDAFSIPYFDLSPGYVNIINDLLVSYSIVGYAYRGRIVPAASIAPVKLSGSLIDISPLSIGDIAPRTYTVNYNYLRLKVEEPPDREELNWEKQESYGLKTTITIDNPVEPFVGGTIQWDVPDFFQYTYVPYTLVRTQYDSYDRVMKRVTTRRSIVAEVAPSYIQHIAGKYLATITGPSGPSAVRQIVPPEGSAPVDTVTTESFTYKVKAPSIFKGASYPAGYEEIESEQTVVEEPVLKLTGSTNVYSIAGQANVEFSYGIGQNERFVAERQVRTYQVAKGQEGQQISKALTTHYLCHAYSQEGQQILADALQKIGNRSPFDTEAAADLFNNAQIVKQVGVTSEINSGREVGLQQRPPQPERTNAIYSAERFYDTVTGTVGDSSGIGVKSYTVPYSPDEKFIKLPDGTYEKEPSAAQMLASGVGTFQSRWDYGIRNGVNVQAGIVGFPFLPVTSVFVRHPKSQTGGYGYAQGVSYTFDVNGGIVSADVLGAGTISQDLKQFFGSSISYRPSDPVIDTRVPDRIIGTVETVGTNAQLTLNTAFPTRILGDGVQALDTLNYWLYKEVNGSASWVDVGTNPVNVLAQYTVVPLYSTRQDASFGCKTSIKVQSLPYALSLLTTLALSTRSVVEAERVLLINVPQSNVSITAYAPDVRIGAAVAAPSSVLAVVALAPAVAIGAAVQVPLSTVGVAALVPGQAGPDGVDVLVPVTGIAVAALVPEGVGANLETFFNSWRLQVYGTDAWVFPDWWAD